MPTVHSDQQSGSGINLKMPRVAGFTLLESVHEGSCGGLFRARQDRLGRIVALRLLPEWPPPTDVSLERFNRAAYAYAQAQHPNLVTLYDSGTRDGFHYISLEFLSGQTLQKQLAQTGGDERFALRMAVCVLRALCALHSKEICHRNIKPKNVFIESDGNIRLIGLGLASCKNAFFSPHLDARPIGTPHFMAPEMIRGVFNDPRSDLYSLGVTLFVTTAGRTPFERGSPLAVMSRHLTDAPDSLATANPKLSPDFVAFVDRLMAREPEERFQTAASALQVAETLCSRYGELPQIPSRPPAPAPQFVPFQSQRMQKVPVGGSTSPLKSPLVIALMSAAATVVLVAGMVQILSWAGFNKRSVNPAATNTPVITQNQAESDEFNRLMDKDKEFASEPMAGADAWANYLAKFPNAPGPKQAIARVRLDLYLSLVNARQQKTDEKVQTKRSNAPDF